MATAMRTTRLPRVLPAQPRLAHTTTPCALPCLTTVRLPHRAPKTACRVQQKDTSDVQPTIATPSTSTSTALVGEDAAAFDLAQQSATSWGVFVALLTGVLALIFVVCDWGLVVHGGWSPVWAGSDMPLFECFFFSGILYLYASSLWTEPPRVGLRMCTCHNIILSSAIITYVQPQHTHTPPSIYIRIHSYIHIHIHSKYSHNPLRYG